MAWEFYDPRRPAAILQKEVANILRETGFTDPHDILDPDVVLEPGIIAASDDVERVVVHSVALPAVEYEDENLAPSLELWKRWRVFFDAAVAHCQPLWAARVSGNLPPTLTELRDPELAEFSGLSDLWVCAELVPALRDLPYRSCLTEPLAGGLWVSSCETVLAGRWPSMEDFEHDHALVREALLRATDHLLPARDPGPHPPPKFQPEEPTSVEVLVHLWRDGTPPQDLYRDLGYVLVERGGEPVEATGWEGVLPLGDDDAVMVTFPEYMPGVLQLQGFSEALLRDDGDAMQAKEALHNWLAEVVAACGASYAALRFDFPAEPPVVYSQQYDGAVLEGPESFAVDRTWLGEESFPKLEQLLEGSWRRDVGTVSAWWVRRGDRLDLDWFDQTLEAAQLIAARSRQPDQPGSAEGR